jgi:Zn-dependent peptidase ImmA (M78 family)
VAGWWLARRQEGGVLVRTSTDDPQAWEHRLDRFARALLLPRERIPTAWTEAQEQGEGLRTTVVRMASDFMVDMATLAHRLLELGLIDAEQADRVRRVRTEKADILEQDLVIRKELCPGSLPREYEKAVLRLYRQESISAARALDLLLDTWKEEDLPELAPLPKEAIWEFVS